VKGSKNMTSTSTEEAARNLFKGCAPERGDEIEAFFKDLQLRFNITEDTDNNGSATPVIEAGCYTLVRFNHRTMRLFWLAAYIAWEAYCAVSKTDEQRVSLLNTDRFKILLQAFEDTKNASNVDSISLPCGIPEPGVYPPSATNPQERAVAELATFAVGWAFLHEIFHIKCQQSGASSSDKNDEEKRKEELACDAYATKFLMEKVGCYARENNVNELDVMRKRRWGIYFAFFAMTLLTKDNWQETSTHPSMQARIDQLQRCLDRKDPDIADAASYTSFIVLKEIYANSPHLKFNS
jgi:hypothetical protein